MSRHLYLIPLLLISFSPQAELYKGIDADGNVIYTDIEIPNAEKIPMPSPNIIQMPKLEPVEKIIEKKARGYSTFKLEQPKNNATLRINDGNVTVSLSLTPDLDTKAGDTISILVDGRVVTKGSTTLTTQVLNIDRGEHTISAAIKDKNNKTIISSNTVIFHMKRQSILHPKP